MAKGFNVETVGNELLAQIKSASWFPYDTGKLKNEATSGEMITKDTYRIKFDSTVAPYVEYLEEGTQPHDIPRAFGRDLPFGIGGRFDGKFHPGSTKHQGFISDKAINTIINYICREYKGELR